MADFFEIAIVFAFLVFFSAVSLKKKALDKKGVLIANIIGLLIFLRGNLLDFLIIVVFFVVAELSTRYARRFAKDKHETRTTGNILGNSGAAIVALLLNSQIGFFGAVSAALADTLSSEIGLLSKKKPVLITTFKKVEPGTDCGITMLGCLASLFGAFIIAALHFLAFNNLLLAFAITVSGVLGSLSDSLFGALFEKKGGLNNSEVNFLGSATGAIAAVVLAKLFGF